MSEFSKKDLALIEKYVDLIFDEYMAYISWDEKLEPESKAIRKKTVQSLRKLLLSYQRRFER